jgi:hypothetical protein
MYKARRSLALRVTDRNTRPTPSPRKVEKVIFRDDPTLQNAKQDSDRQNARIEHDKAFGQAKTAVPSLGLTPSF